MQKAIIHIKGQVAEMMESKGVLHAKIICDTDNLLVSLENVDQLELGGTVNIEGEIKIRSIQVEGIEVYHKEEEV
jgi:hypothetical protein